MAALSRACRALACPLILRRMMPACVGLTQPSHFCDASSASLFSHQSAQCAASGHRGRRFSSPASLVQPALLRSALHAFCARTCCCNARSLTLSHTGGIEIETPQTAWPDFKPNTLFGQMPHLRIDGLEISQSMAIVRVLSRRAKLEGATEADVAMSEMLMEQYVDILSNIASCNQAADKYAQPLRCFIHACAAALSALRSPVPRLAGRQLGLRCLASG